MGASLAASLTTFNDRKVEWGWPKKWSFLLAYRMVGLLWKAQLEGKALPVEKLLEMLEGVTEPVLAEQLRLLFSAGLVTRNEEGNWLLCRDLETITLLDLYHAGEYYLPVGEDLDIPSRSEWDSAFFRSISQDELNMQQSLRDMYTQTAAWHQEE